MSHFLTFTDLRPEEYILYEQGYINEKRGCRSKNFLEENESLVTFYRLYYSEFGGNLAERLAKISTMEERIAFALKMIRSLTGLDVTDYLKKIFMLDMIVLNEDRHVNNLAVIFDGTEFRPAPIFDNGVSLLTANLSVNWHFFHGRKCKASDSQTIFRFPRKKCMNILERDFRWIGTNFCVGLMNRKIRKKKKYFVIRQSAMRKYDFKTELPVKYSTK